MTERVDRDVLGLIKKHDIIDYALREFKIVFAREIKQKSRARIEGKFATFIKMKFNIDQADVNMADLAF